MKIKASIILSFVTGRLYSTTPPTILFSDLCKSILGENRGIQTIEMPFIKDRYSSAIIEQLPQQFSDTIKNWKHSEDWPQKVQMIDETWRIRN